ncbi:hypothetical protein [Hydrogenimonas sp.]
MIRLFTSISLALLLVSSLHAEKVAEKDALLLNMIQAYGGKTALEQASSYIQHWRVLRAADGTEGKETRRVTLPKRLYVDLRYPDKEEIRVLEGTVGIKIFGKHAKKQVFGPMLDAMKLQLLRVYNPLQLKKVSDRIEMTREKEGYILKFVKNGVECDYYVNPKNYHIEKTVGKLKMGPNTMEFVTLYKDFVKQNTVLMPGTEVKYAGGVNTATNRLIDTEFVRLKKVSKHRYERI